MNSRDFSAEQLSYLYENESFLLYLNQYFGTYQTFINNINADLELDEEIKQNEVELYLRIILANTKEFKTVILEIEKNISYVYSDEKRNIQGEIHGVLLVDEYIRKKTMQSMPKTYPCKIKKKTYLTPENIYLLYMIDQIVVKLEKLLMEISHKFKHRKKFEEIKLLEKDIKYFTMLKSKSLFSEVRISLRKIERTYGSLFPKDIRNQIQQRLKKRKIRNYYNYEKIILWFNKYMNSGITFIEKSNLNLLSYDNGFNDKLFELWILYKLKETFVDEYKLQLIESNHLQDRFTKPIYRIASTNGNTIELYFQKGQSLFWDSQNDNKWSYIKLNEKQSLRAIPDIVMKYQGSQEVVVLIDAKNRIKSAGKNSDEIYKMLGYYENFSDYLKRKYGHKFNYNAALIFRNDTEPFKELLNTDSDDSMLNVSVSPSPNENLNKDQFKELCRYLLEVCGNEGNTTEVIGEYKQTVDSRKERITSIFESDNDDLIEDLVHEISDENHKVINNIFTAPELQLQIDKIKEKLERDHFPHIWMKMSDDTKTVLAMAESLFISLKDSENADYAPVCLEYCRALECTLNHVLVKPFIAMNKIPNLIARSKYYNKLSANRDLTLGEAIYLLSKCNANNRFKTNEFKSFIEKNIRHHNGLLGTCIDDLTKINVEFRRKSAHTSIMKYTDLVECRQRILGIGRSNIFYVLLE